MGLLRLRIVRVRTKKEKFAAKMSKQFSVDPAKKAGAGDNTAAKKLGRGGIAGRGESPLPVSWILITGEEEGNCLLDVYFNLSCQRWETRKYKNPHCIFIWGKIWLLNHLVVAETSSHMIACLFEHLYQLSARNKALSSAFCCYLDGYYLGQLDFSPLRYHLHIK